MYLILTLLIYYNELSNKSHINSYRTIIIFMNLSFRLINIRLKQTYNYTEALHSSLFVKKLKVSLLVCDIYTLYIL